MQICREKLQIWFKIGQKYLLPMALQPVVGFGLSNNNRPFISIHHHLSPSSHA
jgi:hypothetical protein